MFATKIVNTHIENGLFYSGGWYLITVQVLGTLFTIVFVGIMTTAIVLTLKRLILIRVSRESELMRLDLAEHDETADYSVDFERK